MKKYLLAAVIFACFVPRAMATHNRAGEITFTQIGFRDYEITVTTYTKIDAPADRCEIEVNWGDGTASSILPRVNGTSQGGCAHWGEPLYNQIKKNIYIGTHSYSRAGTFRVSMHDYNRNEGVKNIPRSVEEPFYIESYVVVGGAKNDSPVLLNPPTDFGCIYQPFIHNPVAYDPDGDSLGYRLVNCRGLNGREITETYNKFYNLGEENIRVAPDGTVTWDSPNAVGEYNIALEIIEYRKNANGTWTTVGKILRDMQIDITDCNNTPPDITVDNRYCVVAGQTLQFDVSAADPDGDKVTLTAIGGSFMTDNPALFEEKKNQPSPVSSTFRWRPDCSQARDGGYTITFKANDHPVNVNGNPVAGLSSQRVVTIEVIIPAVENVAVSQTDSPAGMEITWDPLSCQGITSYKIYRKKYTGDIQIPECQGGVPYGSGYELVGETDASQNRFVDPESGLSPGIRYCYLVTALKGLTEGVPSQPVCAIFMKDAPLITHVSVENTHPTDGSLALRWVAPDPSKIDTGLFPGPYSYRIGYENLSDGTLSKDLDWEGEDWQGDTAQSHGAVNTADYAPHRYTVHFYSQGNRPVSSSVPSTSIHLNASPANNKAVLDLLYEVPWGVDSIIYYRREVPSGRRRTVVPGFVEAGRVTSSSEIFSPFTDRGVVNGVPYEYYAEVYGNYSILQPQSSFVNLSQVASVVPEDREVECPPVLELLQDCQSMTPFILSWTDPENTCQATDIDGYRVFYKKNESDAFDLDNPIYQTRDTTYVLPAEYQRGYVAVVALDRAGNVSELSNVVKVGQCNKIFLPNVFSPNGDAKNDLFVPLVAVPEGDFRIDIFNRWGTLVYSTRDPQIKWDGTNQMLKTKCSPGVYYYSCTLRDAETGEETVQKGFVRIFY